MDWCYCNGLAPSNSFLWGRAEEEYNKFVNLSNNEEK